jgi:hypothetical protein
MNKRNALKKYEEIRTLETKRDQVKALFDDTEQMTTGIIELFTGHLDSRRLTRSMHTFENGIDLVRVLLKAEVYDLSEKIDEITSELKEAKYPVSGDVCKPEDLIRLR